MTPYSMTTSLAGHVISLNFKMMVYLLCIYQSKTFCTLLPLSNFCFSLPMYIFTTLINTTEHFVSKTQWRALFRSIVKYLIPLTYLWWYGFFPLYNFIQINYLASKFASLILQPPDNSHPITNGKLFANHCLV